MNRYAISYIYFMTQYTVNIFFTANSFMLSVKLIVSMSFYRKFILIIFEENNIAYFMCLKYFLLYLVLMKALELGVKMIRRIRRQFRG